MRGEQVINSPVDGLIVGFVLAAIGPNLIIWNRKIGRFWHGVYGDTLTRASGAGPTSTGRYPIAILTGCGFIVGAVACVAYGFSQ